MLIQFDHITWVLKDLLLFKGRLWEEDLVDLEESLFVVDEEVKEVVSILLGELFEFNSALGHLG